MWCSGAAAGSRPVWICRHLMAAMALCSAALIVYSLSRLARSTRDTIDIAERLQKAGSDLVSLSERIDTSTAVGRMFFRLMAILAEFERDQLTERTRAALDHKKSKGERIGQIPYGYRLGDDGRTLVPCEDELITLGLMQDYHAQGLSLRAISRALEQQGRLSKQGRAFAPSTIKMLLESAT